MFVKNLQISMYVNMSCVQSPLPWLCSCIKAYTGMSLVIIFLNLKRLCLDALQMVERLDEGSLPPEIGPLDYKGLYAVHLYTALLSETTLVWHL